MEAAVLRPRLTRRRFLTGAAVVAAGGAGAGVALDRGGGLPYVELPEPQPGLPSRQHAWDATLHRDRFGNPLAARFDRLLFFDVAGKPSPAHARLLEAALRKLEHRYQWGPDGMLSTVGWSPHYFETALQVSSPIPHARGLSDFEEPSIDDYDVCLHLACDDERRLAEVESELTRELAPALRWRETRSGFTGVGLAAARQRVGGIPGGDPVPKDSPLFMGFSSALKKNQASEDYVTIKDGPFAGGTTQHVSYMRLRLDSWYQQLNNAQRVARMYAPQVTPAQEAAFTTDAAGDPSGYGEAVNKYGVLGHAQTCARARRNNKPTMIRRDFATTDGGQAGTHFVAWQRSIEDFITVRNFMNASSAQLSNPSITDTVNNGINEFMFVLKRANYIIPPRAERSFPLLPGRDRALA